MTAASGFKRLGLALAAVLVIGAGILTIISFLISVDTARDAVKAEIRSVSGLEPVLRGPVSVSFFPFGSVSFQDVAIGEDTAGNQALTADRLTARLRFFPLLIGRIQVSDVTLVRPTVNVMLDSNGKSNWTPLAGILSAALLPNVGRTASFSEIRIDDGTVVVRDETRAITDTIDHIEGSLAWPSMFRSFAATGRFDWRGEKLETSLSLTDFAAALAGNQSGVKLRISGAPIKFAFEGQFSSRPTWKIEGTVAADSPSLREAVRWAWDKQLPGGGFNRFALKAKTNLVGSTLALSSADIEIDGNTAEGVLTFAADGRKTLQGTLAAESLNFTPYVSTVRLLSNGEREWNGTPISFDNLAGIDLDLRLSAAHAKIAKVTFGRTAIAANLRGGQLTVTVGESQSFGGTISGFLDITQSSSGADVKAQMQFADVDMRNCLDAVLGTPRIEGKGTLSFNVEGTGESVMAISRTLTGSASLTGQKGVVTGLNIEKLLRQLERQPLSGGGDYKNGRTPYDKLNVALNISHGVVNAEEISMDSQAVRLNLRGTTAIPVRSLDFKGTANLVSASEGPGFELPFMIRGSWDDPVMQLDTDSLIRRAPAAAGLLNAVRNGTSRNAVRDAIDRLVGAPPAPAPAAAKADEN